VIGALGLSTPQGAIEGIDAFFLIGQYMSLILACLLAFGISAAIALILARGLLAPIKALEAGARTLSSGQYFVRIPNRRRHELGDLIDHNDALAQSLQAVEAA
jgi:two-component system, OmpR family, sensor histidine kinase BaeS